MCVVNHVLFYQRKKENMVVSAIPERRQNAANETRLFHGTCRDVVEAICKQNFDWRECGKNGTVYGKGSYFAVDASLSHKYAKQHGDYYFMFLATVLVGSYTVGRHEYLKPPPKQDPSNPASDRYDSCVDNTDNPKIFVVFEFDQCYPEYIISYFKLDSSVARCALLDPSPCTIQYLRLRRWPAISKLANYRPLMMNTNIQPSSSYSNLRRLTTATGTHGMKFTESMLSSQSLQRKMASSTSNLQQNQPAKTPGNSQEKSTKSGASSHNSRPGIVASGSTSVSTAAPGNFQARLTKCGASSHNFSSDIVPSTSSPNPQSQAKSTAAPGNSQATSAKSGASNRSLSRVPSTSTPNLDIAITSRAEYRSRMTNKTKQPPSSNSKFQSPTTATGTHQMEATNSGQRLKANKELASSSPNLQQQQPPKTCGNSQVKSAKSGASNHDLNSDTVSPTSTSNPQSQAKSTIVPGNSQAKSAKSRAASRNLKRVPSTSTPNLQQATSAVKKQRRHSVDSGILGLRSKKGKRFNANLRKRRCLIQ